MEHDTGPHHPERPARIQAIHDRLDEVGLLSQLQRIEPSPIDTSLIEPVHPAEYISRVRFSP